MLTLARATERMAYTFRLPDSSAPFDGADWTAVFSARGLCSLTLQSHAANDASEPGRGDKRLQRVKELLGRRLAGHDAPMKFEEFDLTGAPGFHYRVWKAMHRIPFGETMTYGDLADAAGSPMAARACGQACGSNRIILFIPCHRVVSSLGIGGFGCGLHWKKALLKLENAEFPVT